MRKERTKPPPAKAKAVQKTAKKGGGAKARAVVPKPKTGAKAYPVMVPPTLGATPTPEGFEVDPHYDAAPQFTRCRDRTTYRVDSSRCVRRSEVTAGQRISDGLGSTLDPVIRQMWRVPGGTTDAGDGLVTYDERGVSGSFTSFTVSVKNTCQADVTVVMTTAEAVKTGGLDLGHIDVRRALVRKDLKPGQKVDVTLTSKDLTFTALNRTISADTKELWLTLFDLLVTIPDTPPPSMSQNYAASGKLADQTTATYTGRRYDGEAEVLQMAVTVNYDAQPVPKDGKVERKDVFAANFFTALDTPYVVSRHTTTTVDGFIEVEGTATASDLAYDFSVLGYNSVGLVYANDGKGSSYCYVAVIGSADGDAAVRSRRAKKEGGKVVAGLPTAWRNTAAEEKPGTYLEFPFAAASMYDAAGYDPEGRVGGVFVFHEEKWKLWDYRTGKPRHTDGEWQGDGMDEYGWTVGVLPPKGNVRMVQFTTSGADGRLRRHNRVSTAVLNDPKDFLKWLIRGIQVAIAIAKIAALFI